MHKHKQYGFTIVELLIAVVVIAIIAAITIVAYNGIQNSANDTAIKSDIANFEKKIRLYIAEFDTIPPGGSFDGSASNPPYAGMNIKLSKSAYSTDTHNASYCRGVVSGETVWAVSIKSKSGNVFLLRSNNGLVNRGNVSHGSTSACSGMDAGYTYSYGYNTTTNTWFSWTS